MGNWIYIFYAVVSVTGGTEYRFWGEVHAFESEYLCQLEGPLEIHNRIMKFYPNADVHHSGCFKVTVDLTS